MTLTLLSQSSSSPCQHPANHYNTSIITLLHYNKDMPFFIPINLSWFFPKIMFYKTLKTTNLQSSKIQGTYFKTCALYFKIYGLYFLLHALCTFLCPIHHEQYSTIVIYILIQTTYKQEIKLNTQPFCFTIKS